MISKGDLVRMRLRIGGDGTKPLMEMLIFGTVKNYSEDEDSYIVEPRVISVPKEHVEAIDTLPKDFDFEDVSMELNVGQGNRNKQKPDEVTDIRFSKPAK
ncbi:MAG: hypothetical protein C4520_19125 [Candidatus Abyssobacteria bacterium SURF_5]|uniref:Uncharacterized protein n=1 Tax=Abyssobacteria bacterium (strain SURF_5) TaxID=2093360 RepID=A0A3A4N240_ABYX5|nr:MAG: hypothetical protein C4520_19125 [Candidatus Abyssubacteria bacterium SURF_5]